MNFPSAAMSMECSSATSSRLQGDLEVVRLWRKPKDLLGKSFQAKNIDPMSLNISATPLALLRTPPPPAPITLLHDVWRLQ